jgi:hypothetical protein
MVWRISEININEPKRGEGGVKLQPTNIEIKKKTQVLWTRLYQMFYMIYLNKNQALKLGDEKYVRILQNKIKRIGMSYMKKKKKSLVLVI